MKRRIKWNSKRHNVIFDIKNQKMILDGKVYLLQAVSNEKLLCMCDENKIYVTQDYYKDEHIMYYCCRKVLEGGNPGEKKYIDILVYNDALNTIGDDVYNRSIGHRNDTNEVEIHQVLSGKVLELIEFKSRRYLGVFGKGEYFEIPSGAFHCTYVLEDNTIVANIFGNVFWENNYLIKPYCVDKNGVIISNKDGQWFYDSDEGDTAILNSHLGNVSEVRCFPYSTIKKEDLPITKEYGVNKAEDIFELFGRLTCEQEKAGA